MVSASREFPGQVCLLLDRKFLRHVTHVGETQIVRRPGVGEALAQFVNRSSALQHSRPETERFALVEACWVNGALAKHHCLTPTECTYSIVVFNVR